MALSRSHNRPESVPALDLGHIGGNFPKDDHKLQNPSKSEPRLQTPDSKSTISWGTGLSTPYHVTRHDIKFGGTVHRPCTHVRHKNLPPDKPSLQARVEEEHKQEYERRNRKLKEDFANHTKNESFANKSSKPNETMKLESRDPDVGEKGGRAKSSYWYLDKELRDDPPTPKVDTSPTIDDLAHMQADYTSQSYTDIHSARKYAAEDDLAAKQKEQVMEQVLVDLLSRHVISDPDQDKDPARANPADPLRQQPGMSMPPVRHRSRRLHDTKVSTVGAVTETSLKSRVTFSARILTQNGRDALRELFGFFFHQDHTITVYEFRNFGKNNFKALPLITRGKYQHQSGRRKGKDISSNDIQLGKNLAFVTANQRHLPDTIKKRECSIWPDLLSLSLVEEFPLAQQYHFADAGRPKSLTVEFGGVLVILIGPADGKLLTIRISELDDSNSAGNWGYSTDDRALDTDARRERKDRDIMRKIQAFVRNKLSSRSVSTLMGLGQLFRNLDKSGDGLLSKSELSDALEKFGISIPTEDFESVWRVVDENNDGAIDYGEFMRAFIGEMVENRKQIVRKVFKKLDPHKNGSTTLLDMNKLYSARKHPLVTSGQLTQEEMEVRFIDSFNQTTSLEPGRVSYVEFEEYYEGLSIVITSDTDFSNMMKNCWGV